MHVSRVRSWWAFSLTMTCFCVVKFIRCHSPLSKCGGGHMDNKDGAEAPSLFIIAFVSNFQRSD